jgi:hypothetical protein
MVVFRRPQVAWQCQTPICSTEVIREMRSRKSSSLNELDVLVRGIYFEKKRTAETLQPYLKFGNFKPRLKRGIFKSISRLNGSFSTVMLWLSEMGSQD